MFKQENRIFPEEIQKYGCYFFCLLRICEIEAGKELTEDQVICLYNDAKFKRFIGAQCSVEKPDQVCALAMKVLDCKLAVYQVGSYEKGKSYFWGWASKPPMNDPEYIALKYPTKGEIGHHYVLGNKSMTILFDPSVTDYTQRPLIGGLWHKVIG